MHLFEFEDHPNIPPSIRATLLEILELCNRRFRPYYPWVASEVLAQVRETNVKRIVELGAGTAPITKELARIDETDGLILTPCDLYPDVELFHELERSFPGKVQAICEPQDFSKEQDWDADTMLVLSATFHHIPPAERQRVLQALTQSASSVMVFEPVRNNPISMMLVFTAIFPALLLPYFSNRQTILRNILWCWLVPVAGPMFVWDGVVGCLRQWNSKKWKHELAKVVSGNRTPRIRSWIHSQAVSW